MSSLQFVDLLPAESVERAQEALAQGHAEAWEALDTHLRWYLVSYLQNRSVEESELGDALLNAVLWAEREERETWTVRWTYLLELLRDAEHQPAFASELRAVGPEGRAAELLKILAEATRPLRPTDLTKLTRLSLQQVSNLGRKLESTGLIVRRSSEGKATWWFPTVRGFKLAELLPVPQPVRVKEEDAEVPETQFWKIDDHFNVKVA